MDDILFAVCDDDEIACKAVMIKVVKVFNEFNLETNSDKYTSSNLLLQMIKNKHYDLIFLDIDMPELDGIQLATYLNSMDNPPDIIFV